MKQVQVKKTETESHSKITVERTMWINEDVWERIVKDPTPLRNVKWELIGTQAKPAPKEKELMGNLGTTHLTEKVEGVEHAKEDPEYKNYSDAELREACKNAEIKFSNVEGREKLIAKLEVNDKSNSSK